MEAPVVTYWVVLHDADLTETGSPTRRTYVQLCWYGFRNHHDSRPILALLEQWCFDRFGTKVGYVQNIAPTDQWRISESDRQAWEKARPVRWGGRNTETRRVVLNAGSGSVEVVRDENALEVGPVKLCRECGQELPTARTNVSR